MPPYAESAMAAAHHQPLFRIFGFPVHVGAGFVIFMVLLAFLNNGGEFGWWLAGSVAAFTLVHELAHAWVARRAGADASISLEFMAGFTSYSAAHPLNRRWTLAISLAGPLVHIAAGVAVLVALGGDPLERPSAFESARLAAVWWAGPVIGLLNLIPVLPLDGGHATMTVLDRVLPSGKAEGVMIYGSVAVTLAALAATPFVDRLSGMTVFIGFLLLIQLQSLFAHRARTAVSPIDAAVAIYRNGDRPRAEAMLAKAFTRRAPLLETPQRCPRRTDTGRARRPRRPPAAAVPPWHSRQRVPADDPVDPLQPRPGGGGVRRLRLRRRPDADGGVRRRPCRSCVG